MYEVEMVNEISLLQERLRNFDFGSCIPHSELIFESEGDDDVVVNSDIMDVDSHIRILSIDIGIHHLGLATGLATNSYEFVKMMDVKLINITNYTHKTVPASSCRLQHTRACSDWLEHVFQEHFELFDSANVILIERQPPMGLTAIEQLIFNKFREKAILVHPSSMHKHFNINRLSYEERKRMTEKMARRFLSHPVFFHEYNKFSRKHDIADAICLMIFWLSGKNIEFLSEERRKLLLSRTICLKKYSNMSANDWLEQFRYVPDPVKMEFVIR